MPHMLDTQVVVFCSWREHVASYNALDYSAIRAWPICWIQKQWYFVVGESMQHRTNALDYSAIRAGPEAGYRRSDFCLWSEKACSTVQRIRLLGHQGMPHMLDTEVVLFVVGESVEHRTTHQTTRPSGHAPYAGYRSSGILQWSEKACSTVQRIRLLGRQGMPNMLDTEVVIFCSGRRKHVAPYNTLDYSAVRACPICWIQKQWYFVVGESVEHRTTHQTTRPSGHAPYAGYRSSGILQSEKAWSTVQRIRLLGHQGMPHMLDTEVVVFCSRIKAWSTVQRIRLLDHQACPVCWIQKQWYFAVVGESMQHRTTHQTTRPSGHAPYAGYRSSGFGSGRRKHAAT